MERDLNNDEFEIFLKQKVDQHKLYPSDSAWKGIFNSLHPGMKWFKVGATLLVLSTLAILYQETSFFNSTDQFASKPAVNNHASNSRSPSLNVVTNSNDSKSIGNDDKTVPLQSLSGNKIEPITTFGLGAANSSAEVLPGISGERFSALENKDGFEVHSNLKGFLLHNIQTLSIGSTINVGIPANQVAAPAAKHDEQADIAAVDNIIGKPISSTVIGNTISGDEIVSVKDLNWLQEMAAIKLTPPKRSKFNLQFYFSPTVSYRRLADNQNTSHSSLLNLTSVSRDLNINRYVDHNPAIGVELGSNVLFSATKNFILKSGLQLNYSRYNIKAFKAPYEKASIALSNSGRVADTISSYTSLRNLNGYASEELQNQYLQVSVPVGMELKLAGNKRLQFSVAGTIQPTFLLFSDTYLLSTNYLNYTKEPSLVRKWNVHSSFEAFLSYKTGGLRWQLGPQFRYQLMSSFIDRYPIKEYLFEYGVKIGVSKTIR